MITKIKYALAFIWGAAYAASWFLLYTIPKEDLINIAPFTFVAGSTLGLLILVVDFLKENWDKE